MRSTSDRIGPQRLHNQPDLIAFNGDKRYLAELSVPVHPLLLELELTDPALYLATSPGAAQRLAIAARTL